MQFCITIRLVQLNLSILVDKKVIMDYRVSTTKHLILLYRKNWLSALDFVTFTEGCLQQNFNVNVLKKFFKYTWPLDIMR